MTRKNVKLTFTARYDGSLLAPRPREFAPVLMTWSSAQRSATTPRRKHYFPIVWQNADLTDSGDMDAHVMFECAAPDDEKSLAVIENDMTIGVRVKAHQPNERGDVSLQNCGDALLPLGQLLREAFAESCDREVAWSSVADKAMPLKMRFPVFENNSGERVVKGFVVISNMRAEVDGSRVALGVPLTSDNQLEPLDEFAYVPHNEQIFSAFVQDVMVRNIMLFTDQAAQNGIEFKASAAEAQRIHAPFFQTPAGLLPGFAYMLKPGAAAPTPADADRGEQFQLVRNWLARNLQYALLRANRSEHWFAETIERQLAARDTEYDDAGMAECCEILGQMLVIAPTSMPYFSDTVSTKARGKPVRVNEVRGRVAFERSADGSGVHAVERFSEMADNDGGDCEDGGTFAYRIAMTLAAGDWDSTHYRALSAASQLARQYVPMVNLGSVRSAAVGNDLTDNSKLARDADIIDSFVDRQRQYGAHMWGQMQPLVRFVAMVRRTVPDVDASLLWLKGASRAPWTAALPTLILEATGRLSALQLPAAAYVVHDDEKNTRRVAAVARAEDYKRLIKTILRGTRTMRHMTMVRGQDETRNVPNKRINHFYRTTTHSTTASFLPNGLSTIDFVNVQCGGRVPAPSAKTDAEKLFGDNPLSGALSLPAWLGGGGGDDDSSAKKEKKKDRGAARGASDSEGDRGDDGLDSEEELSSDFEEDDSNSDSVDDDPGARPGQSPTRSVDEALSLVGAPFERKRHSKSGDSLLSRKEEGGSVGRLQYGVPMYDNLQTPLLAATGLAPSTPLSGREVRIIAELLRHSPPISMPGDWRDISSMHKARLESLRQNVGADVVASEEKQMREFEALQKSVRAAMGTLQDDGTAPREWPSRASSKWHLVTFIFNASELEQAGAVKAIAADVQFLSTQKIVRYARTLFEEPMPHRRSAVLQFLCDASKA